MSVKFDVGAIMAAARQAAMQAVVRGTESVRNEAVLLVQNPPKTGRIYRRRGVEHQASAPGEPPATDLGGLVGSIRTSYKLEDLMGVVSASTSYAPRLEYGTTRMEPRPYMRPALASRREAIKRDVESSVAAALARFRSR